MTILKIEHISKAFGKNDNVLTDINLEVEKGECIALLGRNGAGKSTLLKLILDQYKPSNGKINIKYNKNNIGYLPQKTIFPDDIKVKEIITFVKSYGKDPLSNKEIQEILKFSDKQLNQMIVTLSGGQQRLLDFCLTIINKPKLLIIDEPTSAMDTNTRKKFWNIISKLQKQDITIIFTTHYVEEVDYTADRVLLLDNGSLIADNTPYKLRMLDNKKILTMDIEFFNLHKNIFKDLEVIFNENTVQLDFDPKNTNKIIKLFINNDLSLSDIELTNSSLLSTIFNIKSK